MRSIPAILQLLQLKINCSFFLRGFLATSCTQHHQFFPSHLPTDFTAPAPLPREEHKSRAAQFPSLLCNSSSLCSQPSSAPLQFVSLVFSLWQVLLGASHSPWWDPLYPRAGQELPELTFFSLCFSGPAAFIGVCSALSRAQPQLISPAQDIKQEPLSGLK